MKLYACSHVAGDDPDSAGGLDPVRTEKLPELGRVLGKTLREFENSASGLIEEEEGKEKKHSK